MQVGDIVYFIDIYDEDVLGVGEITGSDDYEGDDGFPFYVVSADTLDGNTVDSWFGRSELYTYEELEALLDSVVEPEKRFYFTISGSADDIGAVQSMIDRISSSVYTHIDDEQPHSFGAQHYYDDGDYTLRVRYGEKAK